MTNQESQAGRPIPLKREYPEDLESNFVSNVVVQHQADHFVLSFFEVWPPPILGDTEEELEHILDSIEEIEATCVARLVVTPRRMREFIDVMSDSFGKWETRPQGAAAEESEPE